jgi:hypothetical protein
MSRRTEIAYKAQSPGKLAPRNKAQGSGDRETPELEPYITDLGNQGFLNKGLKRPFRIVSILIMVKCSALNAANYTGLTEHLA